MPGPGSGVDDEIGQIPRGLDAFGVPLIDLFDPPPRVIGGLAEPDVPGDEPLTPDVARDVAEPHLGERLADLGPRFGLVEQVVALGQDDPGGRLHGDGARNGLLDGAVEGGRVHRVLPLAGYPAQEGEVAVAVEGVDGTLALPPSQPVEFDVREVEAV